MRDWKLANLANGKDISTGPFWTEKEDYSGGSLEFPNWYRRKFLFHLTYNQNFQSFWLNGKHPMCPFLL